MGQVLDGLGGFALSGKDVVIGMAGGVGRVRNREFSVYILGRDSHVVMVISPLNQELEMSERMDYFEWFEKFKPVANHIETNASFDGTLFETYGAEYDFVAEMVEMDGSRVWTLVESDGDDMSILAGWHLVNRQGYFITEVGFSDAEKDLVVEG
jgi:hypothetical protein